VGGKESLLQREEQVLARNLDGEAALGKYKYLCPPPLPPTVFNPFLNVAEVRLAKLQLQYLERKWVINGRGMFMLYNCHQNRSKSGIQGLLL
jgi:hypothetical protein